MDVGKTKILFLTVRYPYPLIGGDRVKPYKLLEHLGKHYNTTLVSYDIGNTKGEEGIEAIKKLGVSPIVVPYNNKKAGLTSILKFFGKNPVEIDLHQTKEYASIVNKLIASGDYKMVMAFFMRSGEFVRNAKIKKILISEDCRTLYQKRSFAETPNLIQKFVRLYEYIRLKRYEPKLMGCFDAVSLVTKHDVEACRLQNPDVKYYVLTNGTDIEQFIPPEDNTKRKNILFTGRLDVEANRIMLKRICQNILPYVLQEIPDVEFHVAGAYPVKSIRKLLAKTPNCYLHENVPDMVPYLQNTRVYLHPHKGGSGIQNKLIEAMACGCPVVTSTTGNQGINATNAVEAFICDTDDDFVEITKRLLKDDIKMNRVSANARMLIERNLTWDIVHKQLREIMQEQW